MIRLPAAILLFKFSGMKLLKEIFVPFLIAALIFFTGIVIIRILV
jgi:hypothetical protein